MSKYMMGRKAGMTQLFAENGDVIPVTVIECGPITVVQKKTVEKDGYQAVKFGFGEKREKLVNKPDAGQFKKAGVKPMRYLRECRVEEIDKFELGSEIRVGEVFVVGDHIDITGTSKGKGFQGNVKRHGQKGGREAHGSKYHRRVGSNGASASPSRVMKGKKMPGQMGNVRVTVQNLEVAFIDAERNILAVKGAVPGVRGALLELKTTVKNNA